MNSFLRIAAKETAIRLVCGCALFVRLIMAAEFAIRMVVSLTLHMYADATWQFAVALAMLPIWDMRTK